MTPCDAVHSAARRYCQDRIAYWHQRYAQLGHPDYRRGYSDKHRNIFPRYNALEAILVEVERHRPEDFANAQEARNRLWSVGQTAQDCVTKEPQDTVERRAMAEERDLFSAFVDRLDGKLLEGIEPLPYRRTLGDAERQSVWKQLKLHFGVDDRGWYPMCGDRPPHTFAFPADLFNQHLPPREFRRILADVGAARLWELRELGPDREIDLSFFDPHYNGSEGYWCGGDVNWLVYASHESTITISGEWLLARIQERRPALAQHHIDQPTW